MGRGPESFLKAEVNKHLLTLHQTGQAIDPPQPYVFMYVPSGYGKQTIDFLIAARRWVTIEGVLQLDRHATFLGVETKSPGKQPTARQWACMEAIEAAGGVAFWCFDFNGYWDQMYQHGFVTRERPPEKKIAPRGRAAMIL